MHSVGYTAIISMVSHIFFIAITWRVVVSLNVDPLIREGRVTEARILLFFITIAIGTGVSRFFLDLLQWSQDLQFLF